MIDLQRPQTTRHTTMRFVLLRLTWLLRLPVNRTAKVEWFSILGDASVEQALAYDYPLPYEPLPSERYLPGWLDYTFGWP